MFSCLMLKTANNSFPAHKTPQSSQNIYPPQTNPTKQPQKSHAVRQDKGFLTKARCAPAQPVPRGGQSRPKELYTHSLRSQNPHPERVKLVHTTFWLHPLVRGEFERIAENEGLSISQVGAAACEEWIRYNIHKQHASLLRTELRHLIREENRRLGNRLVFFNMRNAFSLEQTRILTTKIFEEMMKEKGMSEEKILELIDKSNKMARKNILRKTPQIKSLLEEWEGLFTDGAQDKNAKEKNENENKKGGRT
jgi:arsenate reductase-like glutaredoxin family protein